MRWTIKICNILQNIRKLHVILILYDKYHFYLLIFFSGSGIGRSDDHVFLFEGDIGMNKSEAINIIQHSQTGRGRRAVIRSRNNLWPKNVPYAIDGSLSKYYIQKVFIEAIKKCFSQELTFLQKDDAFWKKENIFGRQINCICTKLIYRGRSGAAVSHRWRLKTTFSHYKMIRCRA